MSPPEQGHALLAQLGAVERELLLGELQADVDLEVLAALARGQRDRLGQLLAKLEAVAIALERDLAGEHAPLDDVLVRVDDRPVIRDPALRSEDPTTERQSPIGT